MSSHAGPSNKRSFEHINDEEYINIPSENESTEDEQERLEYEPSSKKHCSNEKTLTKKVKKRPKAIAKERRRVVTQEVSDNNDESGIVSSIPESEIPKGGSFVWRYFRRSENLVTSTCAIILSDGKECGVSYNDGSTTSNLIGHLARIHRVFKPIKQIKVR